MKQCTVNFGGVGDKEYAYHTLLDVKKDDIVVVQVPRGVLGLSLAIVANTEPSEFEKAKATAFIVDVVKPRIPEE